MVSVFMLLPSVLILFFALILIPSKSPKRRTEKGVQKNNPKTPLRPTGQHFEAIF
jgi:hypothetical protein